MSLSSVRTHAAEAFDIGGRLVGPGQPPLLVAEISGNHNGDLKRAIRLVREIARTGAEAVKFQTYTADTLTIDHSGPGFLIEGGLWAGRTLYELYQEAMTPWEWHQELFQIARAEGLIPFSTPFDVTAIDFLECLEVPVYKVASFEIVDLELISAIAKTGKPIIMSTGLASLAEVGEAVAIARAHGAGEIILLHCISSYPAPIAEANLAKIAALRAEFGVQVGLSDHTMGIVAPVTAVAFGATLIEKHVTLNRADGGVDSAFSLEMNELAQLAEAVRDAHAAIGSSEDVRTPNEAANVIFRRSLYVVRDMVAGEPFTSDNLRVIRPGHGLAPKHFAGILTRNARENISRGTPLAWSMVD